MRRLAAAALAALAALAASASTRAPAPPGGRVVLDAFESAEGWEALPSEGVSLALSADRDPSGAGALRMDFDFQGHAGWAAARKKFPRTLPANWVLSFTIRGEASPQTLELKLLDPTLRNVWWSVRRNFELPREPRTLRTHRRQVAFAWGPDRGRELTQLGAIEITITAATGGRGTAWIGDLALEELPPPRPLPPPRAWKSDPGGGETQALVLDLAGLQPIGGLSLDWDARDFARVYDVEISRDGRDWSLARRMEASRGGQAFIPLRDVDAASVRLTFRESARGQGYVLNRVAVEPPEFSDSPTRFLEAVAKASPRGRWPRSLVGEQTYWTLVGVAGGASSGLLSEDGAIETSPGSFSLEPFLRSGDRLLTWADARTTASLADGDLPLPSVVRRHEGGPSLEVSAYADGAPEAPTLRARYRVANPGSSAARVTLYVALRPVQVNPPWQFLNVVGGFAPIRSVAWDGRRVEVDGERRVVPDPPPSAFGASAFGDGEIATRIAEGSLPEATRADDAEGLASAALAWDLEVPAGGHRDIVLAVPLAAAEDPTGPPAADFAARREAVSASWRDALGRVGFALPPSGGAIAQTARANLGWILVNRDGPAIRPGTRSYARSWIRDGALTSTALLRLGHFDEVREFLLWYAPFQFESGAVPCCVDRRGADPVPENDSHGELLYLAGEYLRYTGDLETIRTVWPRLAKAAAYIDTLRRTRRTAPYREPPKDLFFGLLPESISHEGYSDRPVHSYWDDFWALRGLRDAGRIARALGRKADAKRIEASREEMQRDVHASIRAVITDRRLDFIPGSADLGDFDATSTTIALEPGAEAGLLPRRPLENTFEKYWERFEARRKDRAADGNVYTPYEWRVAGSFVRLGRRDRAAALFEFFLADRRPEGFQHWAEVVWPKVREPRFIGDMPHGWVGSDFIRAFLDLFVYERLEDEALVLGAGLPEAWLREPGGAGISGIRTPYGKLDLAMSAEGQTLRVRIAGLPAAPRGGLVVPWPLAGRPAEATVNGRPAPLSASGEVLVREVPAELVIGGGADR